MPLSFGGFTRSTLETFAPQLRALGLEPRQAVSSAGKLDAAMGNPADLKPGSMISVQLLSGDYNVGADGTVTYIDGNRVYAFGHRFLDVGATSLPFARSDVIALLPNTNTSFKLSAAREWMGSIGYDGNTGIAGEFGKRAATVPVSVAVTREGKRIDTYQMQMVNDPLLSPLLVQMAVLSAIDATERTVGAATLRISGEMQFQNAPAPVKIDNIFPGRRFEELFRDAAEALGIGAQGGSERARADSVGRGAGSAGSSQETGSAAQHLA
jgi:hypothetical protein